MTERDLSTLMHRATTHIKASDGLRAALVQGPRPHRSTIRARWVTAAGALAAAAVLLAIFAFRPAAAPPTPVSPVEVSVTVTGQLVAIGGPAPGAARPLVGTVVAHRGTATNGPVAASAPTDADGRFSLTVPPGTYELTGASSFIDGGRGLCVSSPVTVTRSTPATAVAVICNIR